jgi:tripartite-type tricarboxylate transporter receptor subunit TctC
MQPSRSSQRRRAAIAALLIAGGAFSPAFAASGSAEEYPARPIHIVVPTAPGGAGDLLARELAARLGSALGVSVVVENKPGASGVIGNDAVAHAAPDGYTLLLGTSATHMIAAQLIPKLPYDPLRDFTTVINAGYPTSVIVVSATLPVRTLGEFIAYARERPGKLNYASSGVGSANHLDTEVFAALAGIRLTHVPYRGTADGYRALLADEVQVMFGAVTSAQRYVRSGKLRALAVLTDRRSPLLPDVPTIAQAGLGSVDMRKWFGVLAPAGTPPEIVARLNQTLDAILHQPSTRAWMDREGFEVAGGSPQDFERVLRADEVKWRDTVQKLGLRPE